MRSAAEMALATSGTTSSVPGTTGTPAAATSLRAWLLSFIRSMASGGGPTKTMPASVQARANSAFSETKP